MVVVDSGFPLEVVVEVGSVVEMVLVVVLVVLHCPTSDEMFG